MKSAAIYSQFRMFRIGNLALGAMLLVNFCAITSCTFPPGCDSSTVYDGLHNLGLAIIYTEKSSNTNKTDSELSTKFTSTGGNSVEVMDSDSTTQKVDVVSGDSAASITAGVSKTINHSVTNTVITSIGVETVVPTPKGETAHGYFGAEGQITSGHLHSKQSCYGATFIDKNPYTTFTPIKGEGNNWCAWVDSNSSTPTTSSQCPEFPNCIGNCKQPPPTPTPKFTPTATILPTCVSLNVPDNDSRIAYMGTGWAYISGPVYAVWDDNDFHTTLTKGDSFSFTFTGTGIELNSATNVDYGLTSFYIDDKLVNTTDFYSAPAKYGAHFQIASGLSCGTHILRGEVIENKRFSLDSLVVDA